MNQMLVYGLIGAFLGGGLGVLIAVAGEDGEIFIASDQPITVAQVQEKLRSKGWLNLQIVGATPISRSLRLEGWSAQEDDG